MTTITTSWQGRVDAVDWDTVRGELDSYGCALTGPLLSPGEAADIASLYPEVSRFRSTVDMARHRFGEGQYRYFARPLPDAVAELRAACWPHLLPIAREWADRTGKLQLVLSVELAKAIDELTLKDNPQDSSGQEETTPR